MLFKRDRKEQAEDVPGPDGLPPEVIVSPDTRRANRTPPGPVLDAAGPPRIDLATWRLRVGGLVAEPREWSWAEFLDLPRVRVFADFHCVTRWSRLGNVWEGVPAGELIRQAGGPLPGARFVLAYGYDFGWTTNMPLAQFLSEDSLVAISHDGEPLTLEHGGPARLIVPQLYAWKSAKWLSAIELIAEDRAGFWERNGYHMHGNPWAEERFGWQ